MRRTALVLLLVAAGAPAMAQTTTNCRQIGDSWTCDTAPSTSGGFAQGMADGLRSGAAIANAFASRNQKKAAAVQFREALDAGDCDRARALAMQFGGHPEDMAAIARCVSPAQRREQLQQTLLADVSSAVREGRCDDAKMLALNANRLDVADQAMRLCTPAAPRPEP